MATRGPTSLTASTSILTSILWRILHSYYTITILVYCIVTAYFFTQTLPLRTPSILSSLSSLDIPNHPNSPWFSSAECVFDRSLPHQPAPAIKSCPGHDWSIRHLDRICGEMHIFVSSKLYGSAGCPYLQQPNLMNTN